MLAASTSASFQQSSVNLGILYSIVKVARSRALSFEILRYLPVSEEAG